MIIYDKYIISRVRNENHGLKRLWAAVFSHQGTPYMRPNIVPSWVSQGLSYTTPHILPHGIPPQPPSIKLEQQQPLKVAKTQASHYLETKAYSEFQFNHMFSTLVMGPRQCGKTYFVEQLWTTPCIRYPSKKPKRITWYYNQWQRRYEQLPGSRVLETTLPLFRVCLSWVTTYTYMKSIPSFIIS